MTSSPLQPRLLNATAQKPTMAARGNPADRQDRATQTTCPRDFASDNGDDSRIESDGMRGDDRLGDDQALRRSTSTSRAR